MSGRGAGRRAAFALAALLLGTAGIAAEAPSGAVARVARHGRVLLDDFSTKVGVPSVTFDHDRHRARYTCRVCHADVGFAMKAGETQISAATNEAGQHCGACHDGKAHGGKVVFRACNGWPRADAARGCTRCHTGPDPRTSPADEAWLRSLPVDAGGEIDWEGAQRRGVITPIDFAEGISPKHAEMKLDRDVTIPTEGTWLRSVTFSHRKHAAWNGCELCHPDIFPLTRRGPVKYGMNDVRAGRYCGVCHVSVAFSVDSCPRCHPAEDRPALR